MAAAIDEVGIQEPARNALLWFFTEASAFMMNQPNVTAPRKAERRLDWAQAEVLRRWQSQLVLEEIMAAVRGGDAERAMTLTERTDAQEYFRQDKSAFPDILGAMIASKHPILVEYVWGELTLSPDIVRDHHLYTRSMLHDTVSSSEMNLLELLLDLGANPNGDPFHHTPLYELANRMGLGNGPDIVRLLANAGAVVDSRSVAKQCTPLHMAARRGKVAVAAALLECGANIEARDSSGDTPLRRAVNCAKPEMVAFLLSKGANPDSVGNKGLTPRQAARGEKMQQLLTPSPSVIQI
jgi:ankyrin repeat protein